MGPGALDAQSTTNMFGHRWGELKRNGRPEKFEKQFWLGRVPGMGDHDGDECGRREWAGWM